MTLEPDDWRHHFRLAFVGWGDGAAPRSSPDARAHARLSACHWLAATVQVARQVTHEAERELEAGIAAQAVQAGAGSRFSSVALHWLMGLVYLASGDEVRVLEEFERELASEQSRHLYARECASNTWYAIGALHLRRKRPRDASAAFEHALARVPTHPMAQVGLAAAVAQPLNVASGHRSFEATLAQAVGLALRDAHMTPLD